MNNPYRTDVEYRFAEFADGFSLDDVPAAVTERAKYVLLDTIGIAIYGSDLEYVRDVLELSETFYGVPPDGAGATSFSTWKTHSPQLAGQANAVAASSTEYYEGTQGAGMPGIHLVPAAIAIAEQLECDGTQLLESIIIGYEIATHVGDQLRPMIGDLHGHGGNHPVGVAATVAYLLELDTDAFANALRIAASPFMIGDWNAILSGATVRNYYSAMCVSHGMWAALLAAAGIDGMPHAVEKSLVGHLRDGPVDTPLLENVASLGDEYYLADNIFKMYPSCRYTHAPLEAVQTIEDSHHLTPGEIRSITVHTTEFATYGDIKRPNSLVDARYSIPFVLSAYLVHGAADLESISPASLRNSEVLELADRIDVTVDPEYDARVRDNVWGAWVEVKLQDGDTVTEHVQDATSGVNPTREEIIAKFRNTVNLCDVPVDVEGLITACMEIEHVENVRTIFAH